MAKRSRQKSDEGLCYLIIVLLLICIAIQGHRVYKMYYPDVKENKGQTSL